MNNKTRSLSLCTGFAALVIAGPWSAHGARVYQTLPADNPPADPGYPEGINVALDTSVATEGTGSWRIENSREGETEVVLAEVALPDDAAPETLVFECWMKGEGIRGRAAPALWCLLGEERYFSYGLNNPVEGKESWTRVRAPFYLQSSQKPDRVQLGVFFEGPGTVWIDDLRLQEAGQHARIGGIIGAVSGILVGIWGAAGGVLAGRGKAKRWVLGVGIVCDLAFVALLLTGTVLFLQGAPFLHWYALVLSGAIGVAVLTMALFIVRYRYQQAESRRMQAMDMN